MPVGVAVLGWLWGSFLNQLVDRTPLRRGDAGEGAPGPRNGNKRGASGVWPQPTLLSPLRSICLACRIPIPWHDNLPVLSYLWLKGRCRACGVPIGRRTLAMETATPLFLLAWQQMSLRMDLSLPVMLWGFGCVSWLLLAIPLGLERRRIRWGFWLLGALLGAGLVTGYMLRL